MSTKTISLLLNKKDYNEIMRYMTYFKKEYGYTYSITELLNEFIEDSFNDKLSNIYAMHQDKAGELIRGRVNTKKVGIIMDKDVYKDFDWMKTFVFKGVSVSELLRIFILNGLKIKKDMEEI